jgi:predicted nucleic acid-binding Zn ribbon protein
MLAPFPSRFQPPLGSPRRSARQRVLAQWRGVDLAPLEKAQERRFLSMADLTQRVLKKELQLDGQVVKAWNELLDPNITAHAQPVGLRKGTLFVNVDSSAWLSEIVRYRRREILERLQHTFGRALVVKISFRIG